MFCIDKSAKSTQQRRGDVVSTSMTHDNVDMTIPKRKGVTWISRASVLQHL